MVVNGIMRYKCGHYHDHSSISVGGDVIWEIECKHEADVCMSARSLGVIRSLYARTHHKLKSTAKML